MDILTGPRGPAWPHGESCPETRRMGPLGALRRRLALAICPELGPRQELYKSGFPPLDGDELDGELDGGARGRLTMAQAERELRALRRAGARMKRRHGDRA